MSPLILWLAISMQNGWDKAKPHVKAWCERHLVADDPNDSDEEVAKRIEELREQFDQDKDQE